MFGHHLLRSTRLHRILYRSYATKSKGKEAVTSNKAGAPPDRIIVPGSDQHHDLPSFLDYAARLNVSPTSTVYVGTHYEYIVSSALRSLGFILTRTGRSKDLGIDLLGHWQVPSFPIPLRVLLQCKAYNKALTPANVRELEGAFTGAPAGWKGEGVLGFLATTTRATKGMRDALIRSSVPMGFLQVTEVGKILQFVWNHQATQNGLEGMGVTARFIPPMVGSKSSNGIEQEIALTWNGWTMSKEQPQVEVIAVKPNAEPKKSKATSEAVKEPEVKSRGRPRKIVELEVKKRGRPRKNASLESEVKPKGTSKAPKNAATNALVVKPRKEVKPTSRGQRKKA